MKINKSLALLAIGIACMGASAQDITIEEMQMLDQWRAQYAAKGVELKPEDEVRLLQRTRAMKAMAASQGSAGNQNGSGGSALGQMLMQRMQQQPQTQVASAPESSMPTISETDARKLLDALPRTQPLSSFERLRDGMKFNGQRYADPEGTAERFALDPDTATAAYVVPTGNYANVKIARLGSGSDPVTIGRLSKNGNRMVFQTSTGKTLSGDLFFPLTDGALLVRDSVGFRYVVGVGTKQIDFPAGWAPAPLQRGNASTTDFSADAIKSCVEAAVNLASFTDADPCAGIADKEDLCTEEKDLKLVYPLTEDVDKVLALALETEKIVLKDKIKDFLKFIPATSIAN